MKLTVVQSQWCNYRVISLPADYVLDIWPIPNYPNGNEAQQIANTWADARAHGATGLLLLGCDIAADPDDLDAMAQAVQDRPGDLHTGLVKLWPGSTGLDHWIWSHRGGTLDQPAILADPMAPVAYVSLGFLWVPRRLLDLAAPDMPGWQWGQADVRLSEVALDHGIPAWAVPGCQPKHLHFQGEHDGGYIRRKAYRHSDTEPGGPGQG